MKVIKFFIKKINNFTNRKYWPIIHFLFFFILTFVLYAKLIAQNYIFVNGDGNVFLNTLSYLRTALLNKELPFWNKLLSAGRPYSADMTNQFFYPVRWLFVLLDTKWFLYSYYSFHLALGATFFTIYLKQIRVHKWVSIFSSIIYYFSIVLGGYRKEHMQIIACIVYLPVILTFIEKYYNSQKTKFLWLSSLVMALQFMIGFPQYVIYTDLFVGIYVIVLEIKTKLPIKQWLFSALAWGALYLGLIMIQIIPFAEMYLKYVQYGASETSIETFRTYSFHPIKLAMMLCPTIFSSNAYASLDTLGQLSVEPEIFLGTISLTFIIYALIEKFRDFRVRSSLLFMIFVLIYAMNGFYDALANIFYHMPILGSFRCSARVMFLFIFWGLVLTAIGMDHLFKEKNFIPFLKIAGFQLLILIILMVSNLSALSNVSGEYTIQYGLIIARYEKTVFILLVAITGIFCIFYVKKFTRYGTLVLCIMLIVFDLYPYWNDCGVTSMEEFGNNTMIEDFLSKQTSDNKVLLAYPYVNGAYQSPMMGDFNMSLGFAGINSYTNFNDPRLSLLLTSVDAWRPSLNSSGQYIGFPQIIKNAYYDNDLLSMLGIKYIIDQEGMMPIESQISGQQLEGVENLLSLDEVQLLQTADLMVYPYEISILPNEMYQISFETDGSELDTELLYIDFCVNAELGTSSLLAGLELKEGQNQYTYYFESGQIPENITSVYVRIVSVGVPEYYTLNHFAINHILTDKIENPYRLAFEDAGTRIYENTNCKEILYVPEAVERIADMNIIYGHNEDIDFDSISYVEGIDSFTASDAVISNIRFNTNNITADIDAAGTTFVNFSQTSYPGWRAYVDGARVNCYEVNGYIQGMTVPQGKHSIEFRFVPVSLYIGAFCSLITLLILIWLIFLKENPYQRKTAP